MIPLETIREDAAAFLKEAQALQKRALRIRKAAEEKIEHIRSRRSASRGKDHGAYIHDGRIEFANNWKIRLTVAERKYFTAVDEQVRGLAFSRNKIWEKICALRQLSTVLYQDNLPEIK